MSKFHVTVRKRDLLLKGRIAVLKVLAVPKLLYISSVLFVPNCFFQVAEKLFTDFLLNDKPAKLKEKNLHRCHKKRGFKSA